MNNTDFMIDNSTMTAHIWAQSVSGAVEVMMLLLPDIMQGGYEVKQYIQDKRPEIFKEESK